MKNKIPLLLILIIPSALYLFFELSHANFKKMPYLGPKHFDALKKDSVPYSVQDYVFYKTATDSLVIDSVNYPVFAMVFINPYLKNKSYNFTSMLEYYKFKTNDMRKLTMFFVAPYDTLFPNYTEQFGIKDMPKTQLVYYKPKVNFEKDISVNYFPEKPTEVAPAFIVLVDKQRHIRGYYDPYQVKDMKQLVQEFEHLKIKDEHAAMEKSDKLKQDKK